jgi:hypothetical protein
VFLAALFVLLSSSDGSGQPRSPSAFSANQAEVHRYLQGKYQIQRIVVQPQDHPLHGPQRYLAVEGVVAPPAVAGRAVRTPSEARALAQAFFGEEAALLGVTPMSEMREVSSRTSRWGQTVVAYQHYVSGLRLEGTWASLTIQPEGHISSVRVQIVPTSPQLLQAVNQPTLSDPQIRLVVKRDLEAAGLDPRTVGHVELEKFAIAAPPYVVWKARVAGESGGFRVSCHYTMDAFSGQILEKMDALQWLTPPTSEDRARAGCPPTNRK